MGVSRGFGELISKIGTIEKELTVLPTEQTKAAAAVFNKSIREQESLATNGTMRLSNVGKQGAKVGTRVLPWQVTPMYSAIVIAATGPLHLVERDIKPHIVAARGLRSSKQKGRGKKNRLAAIAQAALENEPTVGTDLNHVLAFPSGGGVGYAAYVTNPGTKGKHPFEKGVEIGSPIAVQAAGAEVEMVMRKVFL